MSDAGAEAEPAAGSAPPQRRGSEARGKSQNVLVGVRIRPLNSLELSHNNTEVWHERSENTVVETQEDGSEGKSNFYDYVFGPGKSTQDVYDAMAVGIIDSVLEGFNGTIFAYGQTSSGKTHTLMGTPAHPGIIILSVHDIFQHIQENLSSSEFLVRISYMEIYNEEVKDLFQPDDRQLRIVEDKDRGPYVQDLREVVVCDPEQVLELLANGESNRSFGATDMNAQSSRSHTLFKMVIESRIMEAGDAGVIREGWERGKKPVKCSSLNLVDLAGSERVSKTGATGNRLKEGTMINRSLLTLGTVISKLSTGGSGGHIPYRDSKLTRLLSTSLGGNARTAMVSAISPAGRNRDESRSTLLFASRAKRIVNRAKVNEVADAASLLSQYRNEIEQLKAQLQSGASEEVTKRHEEETAALQQEREEQERKAAEAAEQLDKMQKLILMSTTLSRDKKIANKVQANLVAVSSGRRRMDSVMAENLELGNSSSKIRRQSGRSADRQLSVNAIAMMEKISNIRSTYSEEGGAAGSGGLAGVSEDDSDSDSSSSSDDSWSDSDSFDEDEDEDGEGTPREKKVRPFKRITKKKKKIKWRDYEAAVRVLDEKETALDVAGNVQSELNTAIEAKDAELAALRESLAAANETLTERSTELVVKTGELASAADSARELETTLHATKHELSAAVEQGQASQRELESTATRLEASAAGLEETQGHVKELQTQLKDAQQQCHTWETRNVDLQHDCARLQTELSQSAAESEERLTELTQTKEELAEALHDASQTHTQLDIAGAELEGVTARSVELAAELDAGMTELHATAAALVTEKEQHASAAAQLASAKEQIATLTEQARGQEEAAVALRAQHATELGELQGSLSALRLVEQDLGAGNARLARELELARSELHDAAERRTATQAELEAAHAATRREADQLLQLRVELAAKADTLQQAEADVAKRSLEVGEWRALADKLKLDLAAEQEASSAAQHEARTALSELQICARRLEHEQEELRQARETHTRQHDSLVGDKDQLYSEVRRLKSVLEDERAEAARSVKEKRALSDEVVSLEAAKSRYEAARELWEKEKASLQEERRAQGQELNALRHTANQHDMELSAARRNAERLAEEQETTAGKLRSTFDELQTQLNETTELRKRLRGLEEDYSLSQSRLASTEAELATTRDARDSLQERVERLSGQLTALEGEADATRGNLARVTEELGQLRSERTELLAQRAEAAETMDSQSRAIRAEIEAAAQLKSEHGRHVERREQLEAEKGLLSQQLDKAQTDAAEWERSAQRVAAELATEAERNDTLLRQLRQTEETLHAAQRQCERADQEHQAAEIAAADMHVKWQEEEERCVALGRDLAAARREALAAAQARDAAQADSERHEEALRTLEADHLQVRAAFESSAAAVLAHEAELDQRAALLATTEQRLADTMAELQEERSQQTELRSTTFTATKDADALKHERRRLAEDNANLKRVADRVRQDYEAVSAERSTIAAELDGLAAQNSRFRKEVARLQLELEQHARTAGRLEQEREEETEAAEQLRDRLRQSDNSAAQLRKELLSVQEELGLPVDSEALTSVAMQLRLRMQHEASLVAQSRQNAEYWRAEHDGVAQQLSAARHGAEAGSLAETRLQEDLNGLQGEHAQLTAQVARLRTELASAKVAATEVTDERERLESQGERVRQQLAREMERSADMANEMAGLQGELHLLRQQVADAGNQSLLDTSTQAVERATRREAERLQHDNQRLSAQLAEMRSDVMLGQQRALAHEEDLSRAQSDARRAADELERLRGQLHDVKAAHAELNDRLGGQNAALRAERDDLAARVADVPALRTETQQLRDARTALESERANTEAALSALRDELRAQEGSNASLRQQLSHLQAENAALLKVKSEKGQLEEVTSQLRETQARQTDESAQLHHQVLVLTEERDAAARERDRSRERLHSQGAELDALREQASSKGAQLSDAQSEVRSLTEQLSKTRLVAERAQRAQLTAEEAVGTYRGDLERQEATVRRQLQESTLRCESERHKLAALAEEHQQFQHAMTKMRRDLVEQTASNETLTREVQELNNRLHEEQRKAAGMRAEVAAAQQEATRAQDEAMRKEKLAARMKAELQEVQSELHSAKMRALRTRNDTSSSELADMRSALVAAKHDHSLSAAESRSRAAQAAELEAEVSAASQRNRGLQEQLSHMEQAVKSKQEELDVFYQLDVYNVSLSREFREQRSRRKHDLSLRDLSSSPVPHTSPRSPRSPAYSPRFAATPASAAVSPRSPADEDRERLSKLLDIQRLS